MAINSTSNDRDIEIIENGVTLSAFKASHENHVEDSSTCDMLTGEVTPRLTYGISHRVNVCWCKKMKSTGTTIDDVIREKNAYQIIKLRDNDNDNEWYVICEAGRYRQVGSRDLSDIL